MLLRFPFTFAKHLDADTIDQQVQPCRRRVYCNRYGEMLLSAVHGLKSGTSQSKPASLSRLCAIPIAYRRARDGQAELHSSLAVLRLRPRLPLELPFQQMSRSAQMSSEPLCFSAAFQASIHRSILSRA